MKKNFLSIIIIILSIILITSGIILYNYQTDNIFEKATYFFIWGIISFCILGSLFDVIKNIKKNGNDIYKKHEKHVENELYYLDQMEGYKRIIQSYNGFILINEAGIFEVRFIYGIGKVTGDVKDKTLKFKNGYIENPFIVKDSIKYLVLTRNLLIEVKGVRLVTKTKLIFVLENYLRKKIYNKEDIDRIYNEVCYGNNQN